MHACGHDIHITTMIGTARALAAMKKQWHGTVMLIGQPAEEVVDGAKAMLADHLYERFGTPDLAVALHDTNTRAAGTVSVTSGAAMAATTSIDVTMRGIGGHGDLAPIITLQESTPVTYNDPALTARVRAALVAALGAQNVSDELPIMASEDFGLFGLEGHKIPTVLFWLGAMNPARFAAAQAQGKPLPGLHTSLFQPDPEPTLRTGVTAMTSVAMDLLRK
jgi:metal-dependent amidase/aminoacylase/carboxypeptidase family protein